MCFDDGIKCCDISLTGVDNKEIDDPDKIWKCDYCGKLYKLDKNGRKIRVK